MRKAAIYARYSTDGQRATSIDDQIRCGRENAERLGYIVPDELVFFDEAITGRSIGLNKRKGFQRLLSAWDNKKFEAVFIDDVSRIGRDLLELTHFRMRVERSNVRLISRDGVDSSVHGWQLFYDIIGVTASNSVRETAHQVTRGMVGQLERGFMIAAPPFGYRHVRDEGDLGTYWIIDEQESLLVREIFKRRQNGDSFSAVALWLNNQGIPSPRPSKGENTHRYWRPATIRQMIKNTIYRGLFIWNGSPFSKAKAKRENKQLVSINYPRLALRIVENDIWFDCNRPAPSRVPRRGGKHLFAGLMSCGSCGSTLTVATGGSSPALYCAQCSQAKQVGVPGREGRHVSANGVKAVLVYAMQRLFSDELCRIFQERLRDRLSGGHGGRLAALKKNILRKERAATRLIQLIAEADTEDPLARLQYDKVTTEKRLLAAEMVGLEQEVVRKGSGPNEHNLDVNPTSLLPDLFDGAVPIDRLRAVLRSVFPTIEVMGKSSQFSTQFRIEMAREISIAGHLATGDADESERRFNFRVTTGPKRPTAWLVTEF